MLQFKLFILLILSAVTIVNVIALPLPVGSVDLYRRADLFEYYRQESGMRSTLDATPSAGPSAQSQSHPHPQTHSTPTNPSPGPARDDPPSPTPPGHGPGPQDHDALRSQSPAPSEHSSSSSSSIGSTDHVDPAWDRTCHVTGCDMYGKPFARQDGLKRHNNAKHLNLKPHECPLETCGETFTRPDHLKRHMASHEPGAHECPLETCKKTFTRSDHLKRHMKSHASASEPKGEWPAKCDHEECEDRTFNNQSALTQHNNSIEKKKQDRAVAAAAQGKSPLNRGGKNKKGPNKPSRGSNLNKDLGSHGASGSNARS